MTLKPGTILDNKYRVEDVIGRGGFGHVYRGRERLTGEEVAIKELIPGMVGDPTMVQRFIQEARATLRLTHPHIVRTYNVFQDGGTYYLVMEYLIGGSLSDRLRRGSLPTREAVRIIDAICSALDYAHGRGVVHCDIKPANVLFDEQGQVRLADFGIAHVSEQMITRQFMTAVGTAMGTLRYMAPEQLEGVRDDPRLDIYALGAMLYEMLAGRPYLDFETESTPAAQMRNMQRIQAQSPRSLREVNPSTPSWLVEVVERALRKAPEQRFATARELSVALQEGSALVRSSLVSKSSAPEVRQQPPRQAVPVKSAFSRPESRVPSGASSRKAMPQSQQAGDHAYIPEAQDLMKKGRISRRQFLIVATLLGSSLAVAGGLAVVGNLRESTPVPPATDRGGLTAVTSPSASRTTASNEPASTVEPTQISQAASRRGGTLYVASRVQKITHPARFSWISPSNQLRQVAEYLTYTDANGITHPWLLEGWQVSEDLKTWTLKLRQGIMHNNGDEFNAADVVFTMKEWLNEDVGSSMLGLMGGYLGANNIEEVDDYTVRLHLSRAEIAVPEHLFHYPALVLNHRTFEGDFTRAPHGTGPYTLESYSEGERVLMRRRDDYWQKGADGDSLPYLDEVEFVDIGEDSSTWMAAIEAGEVDYLDLSDNMSSNFYLGLKDSPYVVVASVPTGSTRVLRMRTDLKPWTDNRVRQALKLCQDRNKILNLTYFGQGLPGQDFHVAPVHPEYCEKPIPAYNPEKAKQLLAEAGYPDGVQVTLAVGTDWPDAVSYAEILREDAAPAGFDIIVNSMSSSQYWDQWTEVDLGITPWTQRTLGTMILNLGYVADSNGEPVPWNETRWVDEEFSELLAEANGTLDIEARRQIFCDLEQIQMDRGSIGIAYWLNVWSIYSEMLHGVSVHPNGYLQLNEAWKASS